MTDPPELLAGLVQEAYALAQALDCARRQLPSAVAVRQPLTSGISPLPGTRRPMPASRPGLRHSTTLDGIREMVSAAEREVMVVIPGNEAGWRWSGAVAPLIGTAADRGCQVRVLSGAPAGEATGQAVERLAAAGSQVRFGRAPDVPMLVTDLAAALLAAAAVVITQENLVRTLQELVDLAWSCAAPLAQPCRAAVAGGVIAQADVVVLPGLQRQILQLLAEGAKDETISRMLGISVRTCRRHVAEIMASLDAVSRFQAGANAARLGLTASGAGPVPGR